MYEVKNATRMFAALILIAASRVPAFAQSAISGSYSAWTDAEKIQVAELLKEASETACAPALQAARDPQSKSADEPANAAAACIGAFYVNHLPADYPGLDQIKAGILPSP